MANQYGIDVGSALLKAEQINGLRASRQNAVTTNQNQLQERAIELATQQEERAQEQNLLGLQGAATSGDTDALAKLTALDPKRASDLVKALDSADERQIALMDRNNDQMATMVSVIMGADDPAAAYTEFLGSTDLPDELRSVLPPEYNEQWAQMQIAKATAIDDLLGQASGGSVSTAASNALNSAIGKLFGALLDANGNLAGMTDVDARKAAEISAAAETLMQGNPSMAVNQAVQQAAQNLGMKIEGTNEAANNVLSNGGNPAFEGPKEDPLNLGL